MNDDLIEYKISEDRRKLFRSGEMNYFLLMLAVVSIFFGFGCYEYCSEPIMSVIGSILMFMFFCLYYKRVVSRITFSDEELQLEFPLTTIVMDFDNVYVFSVKEYRFQHYIEIEVLAAGMKTSKKCIMQFGPFRKYNMRETAQTLKRIASKKFKNLIN